MRQFAGLLLAGLTIVLSHTSALASKRVALVIGNSAYVHAPPLANPRNDAVDVGNLLKGFGFEVVEGFDLGKQEFEQRLREFAELLEGASSGIFFYAGHGLQVAGENHLVPTDAKLETAAAVNFETVKLDLVQRTMEAEQRSNILFIDACRNNPLARNLARAMGTRSAQIGRGLAQVQAGAGTLVSFSTQPGNVALDGTGRNSPFASALVRQMRSSNDDLTSILIAVRNDVMQATNDHQVPWDHSSLRSRFYFADAPQVPTSTPVTGPTPEWMRVDKSSGAEIETFLSRHPQSAEAAYAKARLNELKKHSTPAKPAHSEIAALNLGPRAIAGSERKRVIAFTYQTPPQEIDPGLRIFRRVPDGRWTSTYPSGFVDKGRERGRIALDGCNGTVIDKEAEKNFYVFIPDKGCPGMMLRFKRGAGSWVIFGHMENVE